MFGCGRSGDSFSKAVDLANPKKQTVIIIPATMN
jgi:hypothetical protein